MIFKIVTFFPSELKEKDWSPSPTMSDFDEHLSTSVAAGKRGLFLPSISMD